MLIAIVANLNTSRFSGYDRYAKYQTESTCKAVSSALYELGYRVEVIEVGPRLLLELKKLSPDAIFNLATSYHTKKQQANVVAMLELSGIPFTGSTFTTHVLGLFKHLAKMNFKMHKVPTPKFQVFTNINQANKIEMISEIEFPVIVKPDAEGSSLGISSQSVIEDPEDVRKLVVELLNTFEPPVLVEQFISGREFTVAVVGYPEPWILPVQEIMFDVGQMFTYDAKIRDEVTVVCPAQIPQSLNQTIKDIAKRAFNSIRCRDIARIDIRVCQNGLPYVLEINTLPGLMPNYSEVARIAEKAGLRYPELIELILKGALKRRTVNF